ncbi:MAG TPA: hypothetical protein VMT52_08485 [Planctomycetota bacterium]|nr:hypothetical protein [Planctomycetota bacterium]
MKSSLDGPSFDHVIGLRGSTGSSGVGLFNSLLASRLGLPYSFLKDSLPAAGGEDVGGAPRFPLFSLKFEELSRSEEDLLERFLRGGSGAAHPPFGLFLHTLAGSEAESLAVRKARIILAGNDEIHAVLSRRILPGQTIRRAFAPSLIPDHFREACRPRPVQLFYFGMAGKVDRERFLRLGSKLDAIHADYQLLSSLAVHQTSDGSCLPDVLEFFRSRFADRFVFFGNLTEMGVSYFLSSPATFLGFYGDGLRSNNTTFNTALRFGKRIITNLDDYSPPEVLTLPNVLDIDRASDAELARFLCVHGACGEPPRDSRPLPAGPSAGLFAWDDLISIVFDALRALPRGQQTLLEIERP